MFGRLTLLFGLAAFGSGVLAGCGGGRAQETSPDGAASVGCPAETSWSVAPLVTSLGGKVDLHATATTKTKAPVPLVWEAFRGTVALPTAAQTTFTCGTGGLQSIVLRPVDETCGTIVKVAVFCMAPDCGNGQVDPGEQCDPPNGSSCLEGCARPCGNGLPDPPEECDPPDGRSCDASCRYIYFDGL